MMPHKNVAIVRLNMKKMNDNSAFDERLDSIEELLRLLVVNSITDDLTSSISSDSCRMRLSLSDKLLEMLDDLDLSCIDSEIRNGYKIIYLEPSIESVFTLNKYIEINSMVKKDYSLIPVFKLEKINGNRKRRFMEERISFVTKKETHIYTYF